VKVKIYVEGGGDREDLQTACRKAFRLFLEKAGFKGRMPSVTACGSRGDAFSRFKTALNSARQDEFVAMLIDSEVAVEVDSATKQVVNPWKQLQQHDKLSTPADVVDDQVHLMVQCMESWFLGDIETLERFFGSGFKKEKIKAEKPEEVDKKSVFSKLEAATAHLKSKGKYTDRSKGKYSFEILGQLDPMKVRAACPQVERLLKILEKKL
jgi:hypothetical protein